MSKSPEQYAITFGFWFGKVVVKGLEKAISKFKDKEEHLYTFKGDYLKRFNLSNKENFKRNIKTVIQIYFSIFFWMYTFIFLNAALNWFNLKTYATLFYAVGITSFLVFILFAYAAYRISYN